MSRILIVEDDAIISLELMYAFEQEGYAVVHGKNVSEAVNAVIKNARTWIWLTRKFSTITLIVGVSKLFLVTEKIFHFYIF